MNVLKMPVCMPKVLDVLTCNVMVHAAGDPALNAMWHCKSATDKHNAGDMETCLRRITGQTLKQEQVPRYLF